MAPKNLPKWSQVGFKSHSRGIQEAFKHECNATTHTWFGLDFLKPPARPHANHMPITANHSQSRAITCQSHVPITCQSHANLVCQLHANHVLYTYSVVIYASATTRNFQSPRWETDGAGGRRCAVTLAAGVATVAGNLEFGISARRPARARLTRAG